METKAEGALVVAPPAVIGSSWLRRFGQHEVGVVSGWMAIRGIRRRRAVEKGFVLSDHADFQGLNEAVRATGAERVLLTHGYTAQFARWLSSLGIDADELKTDYGVAREEGE
jgi:putative mRNA 3-end processing factor